MNNRGFSILEIMIAMSVSAIILTSLFQIYNQTTRSMQKVKQLIYQDTQLLTFQRRFAQDVTGISGIWFKESELRALGEKTEKKDSSSVPEKLQSFFFFSRNDQGSLDTLTFITTSALPSYHLAHNRFVRVVYKLQQDSEHKDRLCLLRKEIFPASEFIDQAALEQGKFYELITGLKSCTFTYHYLDRKALNKRFNEQNSKKDEPIDNKEQQELVFKHVDEWISPETIQKQDTINTDKDTPEKDLGGALVPKFIQVTFVFAQTDHDESKVSLYFIVPSTVDHMPKNISLILTQGEKREEAFAENVK